MMWLHEVLESSGFAVVYQKQIALSTKNIVNITQVFSGIRRVKICDACFEGRERGWRLAYYIVSVF